jgi:hypothetical protein
VPEEAAELALLLLLLPPRPDDDAADSAAAAAADADGGGRRFPPRMRLTDVPPWRVAAPSPISAPSEDLVLPGAFLRDDDDDDDAPEAAMEDERDDGPALDWETGPWKVVDDSSSPRRRNEDEEAVELRGCLLLLMLFSTCPWHDELSSSRVDDAADAVARRGSELLRPVVVVPTLLRWLLFPSWSGGLFQARPDV